jgi:PKD repeat protein
MVNQCMMLMLSVIMCFSMIITIPIVSCIANTPVIYVAGDNSGDFNCNATNAGAQINQALQFVADNPEYTTVYLKGPFSYMTNDTLLLGNDTTLTGDPSATIKLDDNANWNVSKSMVSANSSTHDITIYGFTIDGNRNNNTNVASGQGYYNIFSFSNSQNIYIHNMYLTNNHGDGLHTNECTNLRFYNNSVYLLGHDGIYICNSACVEANNNVITCRTNSGLRIYNTNHVTFHDNIITSQGSGGAGIEIQKDGTDYVMNDIEIYNNIIHDTLYAGVWLFGSGSYSAADTYVHIFNNYIYNTGKKQSSSVVGGILSDGFNGLIENNIINATYGSGISQANIYSALPLDSGFVLTLNNNTITNTRCGYGINDALPSTHYFILQTNYLCNNSPSDYYGITFPVPPVMPTASFNNNISNGYAPLVVQFIDTSQNATNWSWNFGDNSAISLQQNPIHTFTATGTYTVTLTASNINGSSSTSTQIIASPKPILPIASFTASTTTGIAPLSVTFSDKSIGLPTAWSWNFGDNSAISLQQNPIHTFTATGTYTVTLIARNINGSSSTSTQIIASPKPVLPIASFTASTTTGIAPLPVTFSDKSIGLPTAWSWNFGDNSAISSQQNPIHTFTATGTYTVTLTASNINGSSSTSTQIIASSKPVLPVASFTASTTTGITTSPITFTDTSTNIPTSWSWNFGDGTTATTQSVSHTFTKAGKYTVSLTVKNAAGGATATKTVTINTPKVPVASFITSSTSGTITSGITFTDTSTNTPTSWSWNFGDSTTATTQSVSHTFTKAGKYTVSLTVKNAVGSAKATKTVTISTPKIPVASFKASTTTGTTMSAISFTDTSTNSPTSWIWNFGDGTTATTQSVSHTFTKAGKYTVSLTVKNAAGSATATKTVTISIPKVPVASVPLASFTASTTSGKAPITVTFTDKSTNNPTAWSWNFGDKSTSTAKNPVHKYTQTGKYTVILTVKNVTGSNSVTKSGYITVK